MMIKKYIFILMIISFSTVIFSEKSLAVLSEVMKPVQLIISKENIYVIEEYKINIYDKQSLKFKKKFGKKGEGPEEFPRPIQVHFFNKNIFICSFNKMLWFSKEGDYIKEKKKNPLSYKLIPISGGYLQKSMHFSKTSRNITGKTEIFDEDMNLKKILNIEEAKFGNNKNRKELSVFRYKKFSTADKNSIILVDTRIKSSIRIFDHNGNLINSILQEFPKVLITEGYKNQYIEYGISNSSNDMFKQMLKKIKYNFPKHFLPFSNLFSEEKMIYVFRDIPDFSKYEVWAMKKNGEIKNKVLIKKSNCYWIESGIYYYILENDETEEWELYSKKIL